MLQLQIAIWRASSNECFTSRVNALNEETLPDIGPHRPFCVPLETALQFFRRYSYCGLTRCIRKGFDHGLLYQINELDEVTELTYFDFER